MVNCQSKDYSFGTIYSAKSSGIRICDQITILISMWEPWSIYLLIALRLTGMLLCQFIPNLCICYVSILLYSVNHKSHLPYIFGVSEVIYYLQQQPFLSYTSINMLLYLDSKVIQDLQLDSSKLMNKI